MTASACICSLPPSTVPHLQKWPAAQFGVLGQGLLVTADVCVYKGVVEELLAHAALDVCVGCHAFTVCPPEVLIKQS